MVTAPRWQPEAAADKDSLSGSFCLCACGWLNSSQPEWSFFFSQRKFCYFSPCCSSTSFLSFSLSTSSFWNLWVLYFFLAFFFPYFLILENRDLDSPLFVLLFLHVIAPLSEYKISLFILSPFSLTRTRFAGYLLLLSRISCPQNQLNVQVQNREHVVTSHAAVQS